MNCWEHPAFYLVATLGAAVIGGICFYLGVMYGIRWEIRRHD